MGLQIGAAVSSYSVIGDAYVNLGYEAMLGPESPVESESTEGVYHGDTHASRGIAVLLVAGFVIFPLCLSQSISVIANMVGIESSSHCNVPESRFI